MTGDDLPAWRRLAARVLLTLDGAPAVFVGRSPEGLLAYFGGLGSGIAPSRQFVSLNVSVRCLGLTNAERRLLREQLCGVGLSPRQLAQRTRPVWLCDFVASGGTVDLLAREILMWATEEGLERRVRRRLRFLGIVHPFSAQWRRLEHVTRFGTQAVSVESWLWYALANGEEKALPWRPPHTWAQEPLWERSERRLDGLARANWLHELGRTTEERRALSQTFRAVGAYRSKAIRHLVLRWKGNTS